MLIGTRRYEEISLMIAKLVSLERLTFKVCKTESFILWFVKCSVYLYPKKFYVIFSMQNKTWLLKYTRKYTNNNKLQSNIINPWRLRYTLRRWWRIFFVFILKVNFWIFYLGKSLGTSKCFINCLSHLLY